MNEVVLIRPSQAILPSRVVKAVLTALDSVDIKKHFDANFSEAIEGPLNLLLGSIHTINIGTIRLESPVSNWDSD